MILMLISFGNLARNWLVRSLSSKVDWRYFSIKSVIDTKERDTYLNFQVDILYEIIT